MKKLIEPVQLIMKKIGTLLLIILFNIATVAVVSPVFSFQKPTHKFKKDLDIRVKVVKKPANKQLDAFQKLKDKVQKPLIIRWDADTGSPAHIFNGPLSPPSQDQPSNISIGFFKENRDLFGLTDVEINSLVLANEVKSKGSGVTHLYYKQVHNGLEVFGGNASVHIDSKGQIVSVTSHLYSGIGVKEPQAISAADAVVIGVADIRPDLSFKADVKKSGAGKDKWTTVKKGPLARDVEARLVIFPMVDQFRLAWTMDLREADTPNLYKVLVDASNRKILFRKYLTLFQARGWLFQENPPATYPPFPNLTAPTCYDCTPDGCNSAAGQVGSSFEGDAVSSDPAMVSPLGWVSGTETVGNNCDSWNVPNASRASDPDQHFEFYFDTTVHPSNSWEASTTDNFWFCNASHDWLYDLGFDEPSGNYQNDNFGRGGLGGDPIHSYSLDSGNCNAYYIPSPDGSISEIHMFPCSLCSPYSDSDVDSDVYVHEYVHGLSTRLVGGPANDGCLWGIQSGAMGEGWSDWYAMIFSDNDPTNPLADAVAGEYFICNPNGIRRYPYSTNMTINPLTYGDLCNTGCEVHDDGEIWAVTLWDLHKNFVQAYGLDADGRVYPVEAPYDGREMLALLVTEAMKLMPCSPSMLDARDAIIQADQNLNGGANLCMIWDTFARRGMGFNATSAGDSSSVTEDFNTHPSCSPLPYLEYDSHILDDSGGDSDGLPELGEVINMPVTLQNIGSLEDATAISAQLSVNNGKVHILDNSADFPDIPQGGTGQSLAPHFMWWSEADLSQGTTVTFTLDVHYTGTSGTFNNTTTFDLQIGCFGYIMDNAVPYNWIEISSTGTPLSLSDDSYATVSFPFTFNYFGVDYTSVDVTSNGALGFPGFYDYINSCLPDSTKGAFIPVFWDDLNPGAGGVVYYEVQGTAPNRKLIVEWYQVPHYPSTGAVTFEAILSEGTNEIIFQYQDMNFGSPSYDYGASATVGIQRNGSTAIEYSCNSPVITDGLAISFLPQTCQSDNPPDIDVTPASYTVTMGPDEILTLTPDLVIGNTSGGTLGYYLYDQEVSSPLMINKVIKNPYHIELDLSMSGNKESIGKSYLSNKDKGSETNGKKDGNNGRNLNNKVVLSGEFTLLNPVNVLVAAAADATNIISILSAYPDIGVVDYFDARTGTPTLSQLQSYDVVLVLSNYCFFDPAAMGDVLADYVDAEGKVIVGTPVFYDLGYCWGLKGRFVTDGYSPFTGFGDWFLWACLGVFDPLHPIMSGVVNACDDLRQMVSLETDAQWVADWTDDEFVATKGSVVALNTFLADYPDWTGDIPAIVHNSVVYLASGAGDANWLDESQYMGDVDAGDQDNIQVTIDTTGLGIGTYEADIVIRSNDPDENPSMVHVTLNVMPCDINVTPTTLNFGNVGVPSTIGPGETKDLDFTIENMGSADCNITNITTDHGDFSVSTSSATIPPGGKEIVTATCAPTSSGIKVGNAIIESNDPDENPFGVELLCNGWLVGDLDGDGCVGVLDFVKFRGNFGVCE